MGFRLTSFGKVKKKPVKRKRKKKTVKRKRKKTVKRKRKKVVKRRKKFGTIIQMEDSLTLKPIYEKIDGKIISVRFAMIPPPKGKILHVEYKGKRFKKKRNNFLGLLWGSGTNHGDSKLIFSGKVLDSLSRPPHLSIIIKITKCSSRPELIGQEAFVESDRDEISIHPIQTKKEKQKELEEFYNLLDKKNINYSEGIGSKIEDYLAPKITYKDYFTRYDGGYFGKRKRKKTVKRKRKKVVKRRKKRMYKYRKKKFIAKGLRNASEWQEFQKEMSGKGFSQKEVAKFYKQYLASKPNRFTQMIKGGNISGLTREGGRIGKNFIYDEIKRNARVQGRKEFNNLIRGVGGVSGIIKSGGNMDDVAKYIESIRGTRNARLVQSLIDSYKDYKTPRPRRFF